MRTMTRLAAVLSGAALATGLLAGFAGAASAADLPPTKDRVIQPISVKTVLVPTAAQSGARLVVQNRVGDPNDTPESQLWVIDNSSKFDDTGKVIRGGRSYIFQPTFGKPGVRQLCIDIAGNSTQAGARFELRPCDGTPSQVFTLINNRPNLVKNVLSGLYWEASHNGPLVQQKFVGFIDNGLSPAERQALQARASGQNIFFSPKAFNIGGA